MNIGQIITSSIGRGVLVTQKHSPALLMAAGIVGFAGTVYLACRATLKLEQTIDEIVEDVEAAEEDRPAMARAYAKGALSLTVLYGPAVVLGVSSTALLVSSHNVLNRRNAALTAAYAAVERGFSEYRRRVAEKIGEQPERELRYGVVRKEDVNEETGEARIVELVDSNQLSPYARFFDELSPNWVRNPEYNLLFLKCQQEYANQMLRARGHVFLNEVYDMLGIPRSRAGAVVGWTLSKDGDNFIDFGIYNPTFEHRLFVNGGEKSILLDFNVDGIIYDQLK